eukprot:Transcript_6298.p2 GENE.Transcript_6298~~Transcript_6298.p2  ORF type:complete len:382 (+),score=118.99 Transcript_6298:240-1385(+)
MRRSSSLDRMPGPRVSPFGVRRVSKKSSSSSSLVVQDVVEAEYSKDELKQLNDAPGPSNGCRSCRSFSSFSSCRAYSIVETYQTFPDLQQRGIDYMRARLNAALHSDPQLESTPEAMGDLRLLRFLRANHWDVATAASEYLDMLRWRRERRMDDVRNKIVAANHSFFCRGGSSLQAIYLHPAAERSQQLQPRTFTVARGAGHTPLLDKHGNLLVIETPGTADFGGIAELGVEQWSEAFVWHIELRVLLLDELSRRSGRLVHTCSVIDFAELNLKVASGMGTKAEKEGFKAWAAVAKSVSHAYPDTTYRNYVLNAPGGFFVSQIIMALAPKRSAKKFVMLGGEGDAVNAKLAEDVSASQLPRHLGGNLDDAGQWDQLRAKKR